MAFDLHENKLSLIKENAERLGLNNIEVKEMDATKIRFLIMYHQLIKFLLMFHVQELEL